MPQTVQYATLKRALELAGGLANLSAATGVTGRELYKAIDSQDVSAWLFLRLADFVNHAEEQKTLSALHGRDANRHAPSKTKQ